MSLQDNCKPISSNVSQNENVKAIIAGFGRVEEDYTRAVALHKEAEELHMDRLTAPAEQKKWAGAPG